MTNKLVKDTTKKLKRKLKNKYSNIDRLGKWTWRFERERYQITWKRYTNEIP
jgi:hypothetical protein